MPDAQRSTPVLAYTGSPRGLRRRARCQPVLSTDVGQAALKPDSSLGPSRDADHQFATEQFPSGSLTKQIREPPSRTV